MSSVIEMLFPQWFDHYLTSRTRQQDRQNDVAMMHMECLLTKRVLKAYRHLKHASSPSPHASFLNQSSQVRHGIDKKSIAKPQSSTCARNPSRICSAYPAILPKATPWYFLQESFSPCSGPRSKQGQETWPQPCLVETNARSEMVRSRRRSESPNNTKARKVHVGRVPMTEKVPIAQFIPIQTKEKEIKVVSQ